MLNIILKKIDTTSIRGFVIVSVILLSLTLIPIVFQDSESNVLQMPERHVNTIDETKQETILKNKEMSYFFRGENGDVICTLHLPEINYRNLSTFFEYLEISGASNSDTDVNIDYAKSELSITFKRNELGESIKSVHNFVTKLQKLGFKESHENKDALWFYSNDGTEILNDGNYTPELEFFLKEQKILFNQAINQSKEIENYDTLIEVGCGVGENLDIASKNHLNYLGLDFSPNKILLFNKRIKQNTYHLNDKYTYKAECIDILDFFDQEHLMQFENSKKPIIIFPFNVIGNIAPVSLLLSKLKMHNLDLLISIYNNDTDTIEMRRQYYMNCGYNDIKEDRDATGFLFKSEEGLYTIAYDELYLKNLLTAYGFKVKITKSKYGLVIHAKS